MPDLVDVARVPGTCGRPVRLHQAGAKSLRGGVLHHAGAIGAGESEVVIPRGVANFGYRGFDLLPDGRVVTVIAADSSELSGRFRPAIQIATNWFELVKERAPVR